jgi:hypothetical protein
MLVTTPFPTIAGKGCATRILGALSAILALSIGLFAQEKTIRPDEAACPVTANLFPEQVRRFDFIRFIFPTTVFPRRISLALIHPQKERISIDFRWVGNRLTRNGTLVVDGDGRTDCYFLGYESIAEDDYIKEFILWVPENVIVKDVAFSSSEREKRKDPNLGGSNPLTRPFLAPQ